MRLGHHHAVRPSPRRSGLPARCGRSPPYSAFRPSFFHSFKLRPASLPACQPAFLPAGRPACLPACLPATPTSVILSPSLSLPPCTASEAGQETLFTDCGAGAGGGPAPRVSPGPRTGQVSQFHVYLLQRSVSAGDGRRWLVHRARDSEASLRAAAKAREETVTLLDRGRD